MAMFDKHKSGKRTEPAPPPQSAPQPVTTAAAASAERTAVIGRGIRISGDVKADSNLRVEGTVEGRSIENEHDVEVAESGKVCANISARKVQVSGEVTGDITGGEKVLIGKSGRVQGNIVAPRVQLEDGALFRGSIDMAPVPAPEAKQTTARATPIDGGARKEPGLTLQSS